ncbi:MAG TPA: hypothetical protein VND67_04545 [Acidimicrobiales bacterium]|nr:hypothetical protein [Acidimicrobiales bacterium]
MRATAAPLNPPPVVLLGVVVVVVVFATVVVVFATVVVVFGTVVVVLVEVVVVVVVTGTVVVVTGTVVVVAAAAGGADASMKAAATNTALAIATPVHERREGRGSESGNSVRAPPCPVTQHPPSCPFPVGGLP